MSHTQPQTGRAISPGTIDLGEAEAGDLVQARIWAAPPTVETHRTGGGRESAIRINLGHRKSTKFMRTQGKLTLKLTQIPLRRLEAKAGPHLLRS